MLSVPPRIVSSYVPRLLELLSISIARQDLKISKRIWETYKKFEKGENWKWNWKLGYEVMNLMRKEGEIQNEQVENWLKSISTWEGFGGKKTGRPRKESKEEVIDEVSNFYTLCDFFFQSRRN
jgi:hypothetical protein